MSKHVKLAEPVLPTEKELLLMNVDDLLSLGGQFLKLQKYHEAEKLYKLAADKGITDSTKWLEAELKLGDVNAERCKRMISEEEFKKSEIDKIKMSTNDPKEKAVFLTSMYFSDAREHYHQFFQKILKKISDVEGPYKSRMVNKLMDVMDKAIELDHEVFEKSCSNISEDSKHYLKQRAISHTKYLSDILSSAFSAFSDVTEDKFSSKLLAHKDEVTKQLADYNEFIVSLLGQETDSIA